MDEPRNIALSILLAFMHENEIDPLVIFTTILSVSILTTETFVGPKLEHVLGLAADAASMSTDKVISLFRDSFYGTKKEGKTGVSKVHYHGVVAWKQSKKKMVLQLYLENSPLECCRFPSLIQVIYAGHDSKSGARVHHVYRHSQDCIIACRDMMMCRSPPLSVMEVPNQLQGTNKWYIDWDMKLARLVFLKGTVSERIDKARELAFSVPATISKIFIALGYISSDTVVQVVIKEGSRPLVGGVDINKISFHFIFQFFGTFGQIRTISDGFLQFLKEYAGTLSAILTGAEDAIDSIESMNGYECLVGVDLHPYSNPEQGLAMGFSKKDLRDPYTRFIEILHVRCDLLCTKDQWTTLN